MANNDNDQNQSSSSKSMKYFKSTIAGLSIQINEPDNDDRADIGIDEAKFTPVRFRDEQAGEYYYLGFLATDDEYVHEVLADDPNVTEIKKSEYDKALPTSEE